MISFYENSQPNQMRYQHRKPDELSFLSDDEDDAAMGFNKNKRMSQLTATDSAYFSEPSNQATNIISSSKDVTSPSSHHNIILWQKQQQQYQKDNNSISSQNITPTTSFDNGNDMTSLNPLDIIPHIDEWDNHSSDNNSTKFSINDNKLRYSLGSNELSYNSPEQRTQRIQLRMSQWKEKLELISPSSVVSSSSSVKGYSGRASPNVNTNNGYRRSNSKRYSSISSSIDMENGFDQHFSSAHSVYSVNSLPNSVFDEKYDSFAEDDRESVFSLRSSNFHSNYNPNSNTYIPPRSKSSLEVRNPHRNSRIYNNRSSSPLKESRIHIMRAELENSQRLYKQKLQQINQMKQDIEQYQYKLEETREKEIKQVRQETIEELEGTIVKNLKYEIQVLQNKLQETTRELEQSKIYSDQLRNELITLKMNEQTFNDDEMKMTIYMINNSLSRKSSKLQRLAMLEEELKKKNEEIIELKKKLDKSTKLNELSHREITLLNKKVENHKQAREDIEQRHTKLVDVASANEIELNKLRYKLDVLTQRQDKTLRKMQKRYSNILEIKEDEKDEDEILTFESNNNNNKYNLFILDLSELEDNTLSGSEDINSDNLEEILDQLNLSDLDINDEEGVDLKDISFEDETILV
ncbi:hypothetical protein LY90DRAFT_707062 [Neocallimastix californiae]|uniref:Uncharacterized protein n=1 Tax=Neocallimastix californiae TaxID=1754190 RepID=A0A1Y2AJJ1_9FUNG|nr:hypothetical protein LY90DRAFT_707062 [Neocallimastix californiae]|eukprot:ORY22738.1 hypothetical protein LY90DRAFT_707062 [Neocallimastix californiae]